MCFTRSSFGSGESEYGFRIHERNDQKHRIPIFCVNGRTQLQLPDVILGTLSQHHLHYPLLWIFHT